MANTCITPTLIGISANPCDCYTTELNDVTPVDPDWYKKSDSGLYMDELESEGLVSMRASDGTLTCDKTLGTFYKESRDGAIKRAIDDAFTVINERFKPKREAFIGQIGGSKFNRSLPISGAVIAGVELSPNSFVDGVFKITRMTIGSSVSKETTISIFRIFPTLQDVDPELVTNIDNVTLIANKSTIKYFADPIILPMEVDGDPVKYIFIRDLDEGEMLPNTSRSCGCGRKEHLFNQYASFNGITLDADAEDFSDYITSSYTHGISLEGEFTCDSEAILCRMFERSTAFKKVFAYAVNYLAAAMVNEKVSRAPDITRWNMINFEDMRASAIAFRQEYKDRLTWLAQNTDPNVNDCYNCGKSSVLEMNKIKIPG